MNQTEWESPREKIRLHAEQVASDHVRRCLEDNPIEQPINPFTSTFDEYARDKAIVKRSKWRKIKEAKQ
jgi:hypothetical protein